MLSGLLYHNSLNWSTFQWQGYWLVFLLLQSCTRFYNDPCIYANSADSDQMPHSVASDLGLQFVNYPFGGFKQKWEKKPFKTSQ